MNPVTNAPGKTGGRELAAWSFVATMIFGTAAVLLPDDMASRANGVFNLLLPVSVAFVMAAYYDKSKRVQEKHDVAG